MPLPDTRAGEPRPSPGRPAARTAETSDDPNRLAAASDRDATVSVVIPTYNEAANVRRVVDRCRRALADRTFEIVVVDDDSPDGTWRVVGEAFEDDPRIRVVRRTDERGLATAVSRGFGEANGELVAVLDADLQHPPERLPDLLDAFDADTDVVVASRHVEDGGIENWSLGRRLVSRGARLLARAAIPSVRGVSDPLSGFFVVRRSVLAGEPLSPTGYKILLELLVRCPASRTREVPYVFTEREHGRSKLTLAEYGNFLRHLVRLRRETVRPEGASGSSGEPTPSSRLH